MIIKKNTYSVNSISKNSFGESAISKLSIAESEERFEKEYYKNPVKFAAQSFFIPDTNCFDWQNSEVINQAGNGKNFKLVDSFCHRITPTMTTTTKSLPFGGVTTEFTIEGWVRKETDILNTAPFSYVGNMRTFTGDALGFASGSPFGSGGGSTSTGTFLTGEWYYMVITCKSGGKARIYLNGVMTVEINASTFDYTAINTNQLQFGVFSLRGDFSYFNVKFWNKEFTQLDINYTYVNKYKHVTDNPNCSFVPSVNLKDNLKIWYKIAEGNGGWLDSSGNGNNLFTFHSTFNTGWNNNNQLFHANVYYGCTYTSADSGVTWTYKPFDATGKTTLTVTELATNNGYTKHMLQDLCSFLNVETKLQAKEDGLIDYNNLIYDSEGAKNKISFSDYVSNLGNILYTDTSELNYIRKFIGFSEATTKYNDYFNIGRHSSKCELFIGDSEAALYQRIAFLLSQSHGDGSVISEQVSTGGAASYKIVDGYLRLTVDNGTHRPKDIATHYPDNPEVWTGYNTEVASTYKPFVDARLWLKEYKLFTILGTNNPTNPYATTSDYGEMHYRLLIDNGIIKDYHNNKTLKAIFHFNPVLVTKQRYDSDFNLYKSYIESLGGKAINPRDVLERCYKALFENRVNEPELQYLINNPIIDSVYCPQGLLTQVDGRWLYWTKNRQNTDVNGNMLVGTIASWTEFSCNIPNSPVTVNNIVYNKFNPNIGSIPLSPPFIPDNAEMFPTSFRSDDIHIDFGGRALVYINSIL